MLEREQLRKRKRRSCRVIPLWDRKTEVYEPLSDSFLQKYGKSRIKVTIKDVNDVRSILEELPASAEKTLVLLQKLKNEVNHETVKRVLANVCDNDAKVLLHKIRHTERILSALKKEIANR